MLCPKHVLHLMDPIGELGQGMNIGYILGLRLLLCVQLFVGWDQEGHKHAFI